MKKICSSLLIIVLTITILISLASCEIIFYNSGSLVELKGEYNSKNGSFIFNDNEFYAKSSNGEISGTYKIKGNKIVFTYKILIEEIEETASFEKGSYWIVIDGIKYENSTTLSGTYEGEYGSYTFKGNEFVAKTYPWEVEGTYKIKGDEIIFTYEFLGEEIEDIADFEKGSGWIKIDGNKYEKK